MHHRRFVRPKAQTASLAERVHQQPQPVWFSGSGTAGGATPLSAGVASTAGAVAVCFGSI